MTRKPDSVEMGYLGAFSTKEDMPTYLHPRHEQRVIKLVKDRQLTTDGIQWSTWVQTTSTPTSKTTNYIASHVSTLAWPGLAGFYVDELEAGLTGSFMSTSTAIDSTMAYRWEIMDNDESTYTAISTWKLIAPGTSTGLQRTVSGIAKLGAGYNKLPLFIRMRGYARGGKMHKMRVKSSSYVALKVKKSS